MTYKVSDFFMKDLAKEIEHLSKDQIVKLVNDYYSGENVKELIENNKININNNSLFKLFPLVKGEEKCQFL